MERFFEGLKESCCEFCIGQLYRRPDAAMWRRRKHALHVEHAPRKERYPSDMTDTEWAIIAPLIPPQRPGGRHRETDMREVMNAVRYVLRTGCLCRRLPKDFLRVL